jgi:hypothetical protein
MMTEEFPSMHKPAEFYRVKVHIDGVWVSAGDFSDLGHAQSRARLIAWHLERHVEIRNQEGQLIHTEDLVLAEGVHTVLFEDSSRNTLSLD